MEALLSGSAQQCIPAKSRGRDLGAYSVADLPGTRRELFGSLPQGLAQPDNLSLYEAAPVAEILLMHST